MDMTRLHQPNLVAAGTVGDHAQHINRARVVAECVAILLLVGCSAWLTFASFMVEHNDLL
jgi:hypothetical protein